MHHVAADPETARVSYVTSVLGKDTVLKLIQPVVEPRERGVMMASRAERPTLPSYYKGRSYRSTLSYSLRPATLRSTLSYPILPLGTRSANRTTLRARGALLSGVERRVDVEASGDSDITKSEAEAEGELGWEWFSWEAYNQKFDVPWNAATLQIGMVGWLLSTITVGFLFIPQFIKFTGVSNLAEFTESQRVTLLFLTQALETATGLAVIYLATRSWMKESESEVFKFSLEKPFERRYGWLIWAVVGLIASVAANIVLSLILTQLGVERTGTGTVDAVIGMLSSDPLNYVSLITVVGIFAPLLEETVFRGFLLTSLTKWMPTYQAIAVSSVVFGCAHLTLKDLPYLTIVGCVWGFMYVRSRNLATPMLMHSTWNSTVLTILYVLTAMGIDIKQFI